MANAKNLSNKDLIAKVEHDTAVYLNGPVLNQVLELTARYETLLNRYDEDCAGARADGFAEGRQQVEAETAAERIEMAALTAKLLGQIQQNTSDLMMAGLERIGHEVSKQKAYMDGYAEGLKDAQEPQSYADKI